jgi:hypothetical protein
MVPMPASRVSIPIDALPVAAAALDGNCVIVAANTAFERLCRPTDASCAGHRLGDLVAEADRPAVEEALSALTVPDGRALHKCSITVSRAKAPPIGIAIDVVRLGRESAVPYLACLLPIPRRRRVDRPPERP